MEKENLYQIGQWDPEKNFQYGLFANGLYRRSQCLYGIVTSKVENFSTEYPSLPEEEDSLDWQVEEILPPALYSQMVNFFRWASTHQGSEAALVLLHSLEKHEYMWYCPTQAASAGAVENTFDDKELIDLQMKGWTLFAGFHSHGNGGAYFSGQDDQSDLRMKFPFLYGVVGQVNQPIPMIRTRVVVENSSYNIDPADLLGHDLEVPVGQFPEEWKNKIRFNQLLNLYEAPTRPLIQEPFNYYQNVDWGWDTNWETNNISFLSGKVIASLVSLSYNNPDLFLEMAQDWMGADIADILAWVKRTSKKDVPMTEEAFFARLQEDRGSVEEILEQPAVWVAGYLLFLES